MPQKIEFKKEWSVFLLFAVLISIFYGNTLANGFIYDDVLIVPQNPYVQSLKYLPKVITGCMWEHTYYDQCKDRAIYYRPVHTLSYILTYQISSQPWFFHLVNLFYFLAIVSLIFILGKILTGNFIFALVSALVFLIHPINSEVVNWIAAVPELTFALFTLLAVIFYIKHRQEKKATLKKFLPSAAFYFLAVMSKEPAIFLPFVFLLIDWKMFRVKPEAFLQWQEIRKYLILAGLLAVYLLMRFAVLGSLIPHGKSPYENFSPAERIYSFFTLFGDYAKKLFYPNPLLFFYRFERQSDFFTLQFFIAIAIAAVFATLVYFALKKNKNVLFIALAWIFWFILPVLIFIDAAGESVLSERYLFIPGIGFAFAVGYFFNQIWQKGQNARTALCLFFGLLAIISLAIIYDRNQGWKNNEIFYRETLSKNPDATPIRFDYAVMLRTQKGDFEAAKVQFDEIVKRNPNWLDMPMVLLHLGDYYQEKGDEQKAIEYWRKSAAFSNDWKTHFAYNRLGVFYARKEEYLKALINFCEAVQINPDSDEIKANFDRALSLASARYEKTPELLYNDVVGSGAFVQSPEEKMKFLSKFCETDYCSYVFLPNFGKYEVILPMFVSASAGKDGQVTIKDSAFNPELNQVMFKIDPKFKDKTIDFVFPTCAGIYYKVTATP